MKSIKTWNEGINNLLLSGLTNSTEKWNRIIVVSRSHWTKKKDLATNFCSQTSSFDKCMSDLSEVGWRQISAVIVPGKRRSSVRRQFKLAYNAEDAISPESVAHPGILDHRHLEAFTGQAGVEVGVQSTAHPVDDYKVDTFSLHHVVELMGYLQTEASSVTICSSIQNC